MKKLNVFFLLFFIGYVSSAQVAINTSGNTPNASAMLDINSSSKGILIPRVHLTSSIDNNTIVNPATSLLVYNTNSNLNKGVGFYYNAGTAASPNWQALQDIMLPFTKSTSDNGSAFTIGNYSSNASSTAIKAIGGGAGMALEVSGRIKINGNGQDPQAGKVLTSDANGNATWEGAVAFSANGVVNTGSHVIAGNTNTKVRFANINYDLNGNYSGPNAATHSVFTAPVNGIYHFDAAVTWDADYIDGYATSLLLVRVRNGNRAELASATANFPDAFFLRQQISKEVQLQAGDQISIEVHHNVNDYVELESYASGIYFNGRLVIKL